MSASICNIELRVLKFINLRTHRRNTLKQFVGSG
jgi:hypothetical protein